MLLLWMCTFCESPQIQRRQAFTNMSILMYVHIRIQVHILKQMKKCYILNLFLCVLYRFISQNFVEFTPTVVKEGEIKSWDENDFEQWSHSLLDVVLWTEETVRTSDTIVETYHQPEAVQRDHPVLSNALQVLEICICSFWLQGKNNTNQLLIVAMQRRQFVLDDGEYWWWVWRWHSYGHYYQINLDTENEKDWKYYWTGKIFRMKWLMIDVHNWKMSSSILTINTRNLRLPFCLSFDYLDNRSSNQLHTWRVYC